MTHHTRSSCRACGGTRLQAFLSLGPTPLANSFLKPEDEFAEERSYPLDVFFCQDCSLVQLLDVIDPETLFRNYIYVSGTSDTMASHHVQYARTVVDFLELKSRDLVVEVASNDGSLLKCFKRRGMRTVGIEPATNIAAVATANGIETLNRFFDSSTAAEVRLSKGPAKVVIGNNVLAHVDDTQDFLRGCTQLLEEDGLVVIEVPYIRDLIDRLEYDTIYHEHLCYFSVNTLMRLCDAVGLSIIRIDQLPIHGGSLRMFAGLNKRHRKHAPDVMALAEHESSAGLTQYTLYERFAAGVRGSRRRIVDLLTSLKKEGKTLAAYGAPAKGNTLLNYCGIDSSYLAYTVDKNPLKVGLRTPGTHIPVLPVSTLLERQPDYLMILAWNFAAEVIQQQREYQKRGGRFIIPIPEPRII